MLCILRMTSNSAGHATHALQRRSLRMLRILRSLVLTQILFLIGITLLIGPQKTLAFFARRQKIRGSIAFGLGIFLILIKRPFIGFAIEMVGILALFGDFFAVIVAFLRSMPVIGPVLSHPAVAPVIDRLAGVRILPV